MIGYLIMQNKKFFVLLTMFLSGISFATPGYLGTSYSNTIKSGQGECVHNSSFDDSNDQLFECNNK